MLELPELPIYVKGDYTRLCQVFTNVLTNAMKFTAPRSRIEVRVSVHPDEQRVAVHIVDDGVGIDAALLPKIFDAFTQGETELRRAKGALGLELALAKGLVELHDGAIEAHSEGIGCGAAFVIRLPLVAAPAHTTAVRSGSEVTRLAPPATQVRVLVVDDNIDAAKTLATLLRMEGCPVQVAHSGTDALDQARAFPPDVVLCDIGLPDIDGLEVARRLRRGTQSNDLLLVALTGYASPRDEAEAAEAGFDQHMAKPPHLDRLLALIAGGAPSRSAQKDS